MKPGCGCVVHRDRRTGREWVNLCPEHAARHREAVERKRKEGWAQDKRS